MNIDRHALCKLSPGSAVICSASTATRAACVNQRRWMNYVQRVRYKEVMETSCIDAMYTRLIKQAGARLVDILNYARMYGCALHCESLRDTIASLRGPANTSHRSVHMAPASKMVWCSMWNALGPAMWHLANMQSTEPTTFQLGLAV